MLWSSTYWLRQQYNMPTEVHARLTFLGGNRRASWNEKRIFAHWSLTDKKWNMTLKLQPLANKRAKPSSTLFYKLWGHPLIVSAIFQPYINTTIGRNSNVASAFRAVWAKPKSTSTLDLVPALAALNKSTLLCIFEIKSRCASDWFLINLYP